MCLIPVVFAGVTALAILLTRHRLKVRRFATCADAAAMIKFGHVVDIKPMHVGIGDPVCQLVPAFAAESDHPVPASDHCAEPDMAWRIERLAEPVGWRGRRLLLSAGVEPFDHWPGRACHVSSLCDGE